MILASDTSNIIFAGCHVVAPSDMMDNRVAAIKRRLADAGLAGKVSKLNKHSTCVVTAYTCH